MAHLAAGDSMPAAATYSVDVGVHCMWTPHAKALPAWPSTTAVRAKCSPTREDEHAVSACRSTSAGNVQMWLKDGE